MQQAQIGQRLTFASCLQAELGYNMSLLDIGGGFPGSEDVKLKFEDVCFIHLVSASGTCTVRAAEHAH